MLIWTIGAIIAFPERKAIDGDGFRSRVRRAARSEAEK